MKKLIILALLAAPLAACGNSKLTPVMTMPDPPAKLMAPPQKLHPIKK